MNTIKLHTKTAASEIIISPDSRNLIGKMGRKLSDNMRVAVITDTHVASLYASCVGDALSASGFSPDILELPAGEAHKTLATVSDIYAFLADRGYTRTDPLIALGGGVVGDIVGFSAATFLRGVSSIQIPTSLLAQVDSSVGGKCGVDLPQGKNLVGAFHQPKYVLIDPHVLKTLPQSEFFNGMAEVIKYGCILDENLFSLIEEQPIERILETVITRCISLKRDIVQQDEFDLGIRMILNYGHTFGHAIEVQGGYSSYSHGQAVSIGMVAATKLGETLSVTEIGTAKRIEKLLSRYHLPTKLPYSIETLSKHMLLDKKMRGDSLQMILLEKIGKAKSRALSTREISSFKQSDFN